MLIFRSLFCRAEGFCSIFVLVSVDLILSSKSEKAEKIPQFRKMYMSDHTSSGGGVLQPTGSHYVTNNEQNLKLSVTKFADDDEGGKSNTK